MNKATKEALMKPLEELLIKSLMNFQEIQLEEESPGGVVRINVTSDEPGMLIGKHGETLFALQQLYRLLVLKNTDFEGTVVLDIDDYRGTQEKNAREMAKDIARRVRVEGEPIELVPMPSYKRRAVHTMFQDETYNDLEVYSVGEGETRRIRVAPKS